jgi:hypothetical protein
VSFEDRGGVRGDTLQRPDEKDFSSLGNGFVIGAVAAGWWSRMGIAPRG